MKNSNSQKKKKKSYEKFWYHTQLRNFIHNLSMWRVVVGRGVSPYGPTIIPPPATTHHIGKLWAKLYNWI